MFAKKYVTSITLFSMLVIGLCFVPSVNQSIRNGQLKSNGKSNAIVVFQDVKDLMKTLQPVAAPEDVMIQYFGKDVVDNILTQSGCVAARMYYGINNENRPRFIIVGINKQGNEIFASIGTSKCPPNCGG
jgi:hypothetical protein